MQRRLVFSLLFAVSAVAQAADRFTVIPLEGLSPEQNKLIQTMLAGPRGGGDTSPEKVNWVREHGLYSGYLQNPELGDRLQKVGEYVRFNTSINPRLNEFAILITARYWTAQYEWYSHLPRALKAGLDPKIAEDLALNKRPAGMKEDEAAVYDFCTQLHRAKKVSDATFKRAVALFGEKGVMDLIGVIGYYTVASMVLNVNEAPVPAGTKETACRIRRGFRSRDENGHWTRTDGTQRRATGKRQRGSGIFTLRAAKVSRRTTRHPCAGTHGRRPSASRFREIRVKNHPEKTMYARISFAILSAALCFGAGAADPLPRAKPESVGMSSARLARIGETLKADVDKGKLPGAVVAVAAGASWSTTRRSAGATRTRMRR